jgi:hypothetical protein
VLTHLLRRAVAAPPAPGYAAWTSPAGRGGARRAGIGPRCSPGADLGVHHGVDFTTPGRPRCRAQVGEPCLRQEQIPLGVADQVLDDPFGSDHAPQKSSETTRLAESALRGRDPLGHQLAYRGVTELVPRPGRDSTPDS